ncbi:MAG: hypothetical protein H6Q20_1404 [Bacteroidetes bacterium]|nr:hypothetical protein [Bacteroidota bacterium]
MFIIRNLFIPFKGFRAINLCGILWVKSDAEITEEVINHEKIHTAQIIELGFIFFYLFYIVEWLVRLIRFKNRAYRNISFEREAYTNQTNMNYLDSRKHYSFLKWM